MKLLIALLLSTIVGVSMATTNLYPRGCVYANGRCVQECPVGTHSYSIGCGIVTREATCRNPRPRPDASQTCDYSACHCVHPTVRDERTGQCVHIDKCPGVKIIKTHGGGGKVKVQHRPQTQQLPQLQQLPQVQQYPQAQQLPQVQQYPQAQQLPQVQQYPQAQQLPQLQQYPQVQQYPQGQLPQLAQLPQLPQLPQQQ